MVIFESELIGSLWSLLKGCKNSMNFRSFSQLAFYRNMNEIIYSHWEMNNLEIELSLQIKLEQDWTEADQQFRILLFISVLDALVFLGKRN